MGLIIVAMGIQFGLNGTKILFESNQYDAAIFAVNFFTEVAAA